MARQVCLQELLVAIGGPLGEKSLWALLYQARNALEEAIKGIFLHSVSINIKP